MKILITGNLGFVGTETTKRLKEEGHEVVGFDVMDGGDIRDVDLFEAYVKQNQPDRILHLAAIARFADADKDPLLAYDTNVRGTQNVVYVASKLHIPLVFASTGSVYMPIAGEPPITEDFKAVGNSVYGCSKAVGEKTVETAKVPWIILRYAHLYGKEKRMHGLIGGYLDRIKRGLKPKLFGGQQSNDFTYIKDVAEANLLALTAPWDKWNQHYNIGTGEELTAEQAGDIICKFADHDGGVDKVEMRSVDPMRFVYDMSKTKAMLGFEAKYSFKDGLTDMFKDD